MRLVAIFSLLGLLLTPAMAQDIPQHDWTGAYAGIHTGIGSGGTTYTWYTAPPNAIDIDVNGLVAGLQGGYDWQMGEVVLGLSGEVSGATINGSALGFPYEFPCDLEACTANVDWYGSIGVRAGVVIDRFMPFVTAGLAAGGVRGAATLQACFPSSPCAFSDVGFGTMLGMGVEVAATENLSLTGKVERVDLGPASFPGGGFRSDNMVFNAITFGANWHF